MRKHRILIVHAFCFFIVTYATLSSMADTGDTAESETASKRISMRFKDASLDNVLEFLSNVYRVHHRQVG